jgi:cytidylate kinase
MISKPNKRSIKLIITIDGPAAAGKGTIAFLLARRYDLLDIDSGALFRAITWLAMQHKLIVDKEHEHKIATLATQHHIVLVPAERGSVMRMGVTVDGQDISQAIRTEALSNEVPKVSALAAVRAVVLDLQRKMVAVADKGVVIEGRDTGTVVFPAAQVKVFLTASAEERAGRRHAELIEQGRQATFEEVYSDLIARDLADVERTLSPLVKPADALLVDSTGTTIEEVVERLSKVIDRVYDALD